MTASSTPTGDKIVSATRRIDAPANVIFDLLANPARHSEIDGSGTVREGHADNPKRLALGDRFGMDMKMGVPYRISNEVVVRGEPGDRGRHFGHHVWRYDLEPDGDATIVTESFNWGVARFPPFYEWMGYPAKHEKNMAATLERLEAVVTASR
ncbi:MAG: SRPBCC family protein [Acidimicrobiales bacterium]